MDTKQKLELELFAAQIRLETTKEIAARGFGHLPGSLSVADALAVLYGKVMRIRPEQPNWEDRDFLVLSKGHAGPALYATLALKGYFPLDELKTLNQPGTHLPSHCDRLQTPGIDMTTGSLGQGASTAMGMTLGRKLAGHPGYTYLFVGDGECDEGQIWESALFAVQQKLDHLILFVDFNKKQLDGCVKEILDLGDPAQKFEAFGFHTLSVDGHDLEAIDAAIKTCKEVQGRPGCIILNTIKGKGLPEIEAMELNHHIQMPEDLAKRSIAYLEEDLARKKGALEHV